MISATLSLVSNLWMWWCVQAFQFSVRLFCAIILQERLRFGLKAELGALYPLLLLKPLDSRPLDSSLLFVALSSIKRLSREPQIQVTNSIVYEIPAIRFLSIFIRNWEQARPSNDSNLICMNSIHHCKIIQN